jgi:hypothetical protein
VDLESKIIEVASLNTIRTLTMETGPEPSRAEPVLADSLPHPDARGAAK